MHANTRNLKRRRVGAVSYLNTKPMIYELERGRMDDQLELLIDHPAGLASRLLNNDIDIGLVPVAIIPQLEEHYIVSDYCIGTLGEVASVCLFSEVPLEQIEVILSDYQSRTSTALLSILIKHFWKINVVSEPTSEPFQHRIKGKTAGLVIGDRAFVQRLASPYIYDLGLAWNEFTGLPFVFAAWISKRVIDEEFLKEFNNAIQQSLESIPLIVMEQNFRLYDLNQYYLKNLSYTLDDDKLKGLNHYLGFLNKDKTFLK